MVRLGSQRAAARVQQHLQEHGTHTHTNTHERRGGIKHHDDTKQQFLPLLQRLNYGDLNKSIVGDRCLKRAVPLACAYTPIDYTAVLIADDDIRVRYVIRPARPHLPEQLYSTTAVAPEQTPIDVVACCVCEDVA